MSRQFHDHFNSTFSLAMMEAGICECGRPDCRPDERELALFNSTYRQQETALLGTTRQLDAHDGRIAGLHATAITSAMFDRLEIEGQIEMLETLEEACRTFRKLVVGNAGREVLGDDYSNLIDLAQSGDLKASFTLAQITLDGLEIKYAAGDPDLTDERMDIARRMVAEMREKLSRMEVIGDGNG
jgi:hypothetical protein